MNKTAMQQEINELLKGFEEEADESVGATKSGSAAGEGEGQQANGQSGEAAEAAAEAGAGSEASGEEGQEEEEEESGEESGVEEGTEESDEIKALKEEIANLKQLIPTGEKKAEEGSEEEGGSEGAEAATLPKLEPVVDKIDIFGGKKFDDITEDEESFTEWATHFSNKIQEATQNAIYKNLPQVVQSYADQQITLKTETKKFYEDNPDLAKHKSEVAKSANLIAAAEPNLDWDNFFKKVAKHARYMLELPATKEPDKEEGGEPKKNKKPALNSKSSKSNSRSSARQPELSGMEKEISNMLEQIDQ